MLQELELELVFFYPLLFPLKKCAIHKIHNNNVGAIFSNKARGQSFQ